MAGKPVCVSTFVLSVHQSPTMIPWTRLCRPFAKRLGKPGTDGSNPAAGKTSAAASRDLISRCGSAMTRTLITGPLPETTVCNLTFRRRKPGLLYRLRAAAAAGKAGERRPGAVGPGEGSGPSGLAPANPFYRLISMSPASVPPCSDYIHALSGAGPFCSFFEPERASTRDHSEQN
jgi:hypothetical protein